MLEAEHYPDLLTDFALPKHEPRREDIRTDRIRGSTEYDTDEVDLQCLLQ
jgi:hypothetical protein